MRPVFAEERQEISSIRHRTRGLIYRVCPRCKREHNTSCNYDGEGWQESVQSIPHNSVLECFKALWRPPFKESLPVEIANRVLPPTLKACIKSGRHHNKRINFEHVLPCEICNQ